MASTTTTEFGREATHGTDFAVGGSASPDHAFADMRRSGQGFAFGTHDDKTTFAAAERCDPAPYAAQGHATQPFAAAEHGAGASSAAQGGGGIAEGVARPPPFAEQGAAAVPFAAGANIPPPYLEPRK